MKYLVLFIVLFSFCCCHKLPHNHINQTLLSQCEFKKGSYWIYKDSLTGILDTFYITERKGWDSRKEDEYYDAITTTIQADTTPDKKGHNFFLFQIEQDFLSIDYFYSEWKGPGGAGSLNPFGLNKSMDIRGATFAKVTNELVVDSNNSFYVAAGIGIVKMIITEASGTKRIWEISDWTIVK